MPAYSLFSVSGSDIVEDGEFTKRAFLNGKLSLTQAEGVMETIIADHDSGMILKNGVDTVIAGKAERWKIDTHEYAVGI